MLVFGIYNFSFIGKAHFVIVDGILPMLLVMASDVSNMSFFGFSVFRRLLGFYSWERRLAREAGVPINESVQKEIIAIRDELGLTQYKFPWED